LPFFEKRRRRRRNHAGGEGRRASSGRKSARAHANASIAAEPESAIEDASDLSELTLDPGALRRAEWVARLERWSDRPLTILAVALIPLLLAPFLFGLSADADAALLEAVYTIWAVFAVMLATAVIVSPDRIGYLRRHWVDVLLVVIPMLGPLRAGRAIHLIWAVAAAGRVLEGSRRVVARRGTGFVLLGASLVVSVAAGLIVSVERDDPHATIRSYGDGLWWAMTTFATVGYGDKYPVTAAGRGIAVALMLLGIAAFGLVTANLAAFFVEEQDDLAKSQLLDMDERLRRMEDILIDTRDHPAPVTILRRGSRKVASRVGKLRKRNRRRAPRAAAMNGNAAAAAVVANGAADSGGRLQAAD
jgi:voltage-gated potassium channel